MGERDTFLFPHLAERCDVARIALWKHMDERGLYERDGWSIYEFTREVDGDNVLVMRPVHSHLSAPAELECVCTIDNPGSRVSVDCTT